MRIVTVAGLVGLGLIGLCACQKHTPGAGGAQTIAAGSPSPGGSAGAGLPPRKPGLWAETMTMTDAPAMPATQECVDAASERRMGIFTAQSVKNCPGGSLHIGHNPDGSISMSSVCDRAALGKNTSNGTATGDFNSAYTIKIDSVTSGASTASMNGDRKITLQARWVGACPAGWSGGDVGAGGVKVNVLGGMGSAAPSPGG